MAIIWIEADLRQLFEPKRREYEAKVNEYKVSEVHREFAALGSPTAEAEYNMDMFLKKYFLDESGKPDKSKTPMPIPLPGFSDRYQMHTEAECIPGLKTHSGGEGDNRTVVVGWDRSAVQRVAGQVAHQSAHRLRQAEGAEWNKLVQRYISLVSQARSRDRAAEFSIHAISGTYLIKCDEISSYDPKESYRTTMRLRITESSCEGCVGMFDFGLIKGIMLLDESKENLASRILSLEDEDQDEFSGETDDSDPEDDDDPEDDNGQEEDDDGQEDDESQTDASGTDGGAPQKRKAQPIEEASRPRKKQKQGQTNGGTVFLQWRGQETGEGEIELDYANKHVGQLNFSDNEGFKFEGTAYFEFIGNIAFQGYKIDSRGGPATRSWNDYSEVAHERARVGRWH